MTNPTSQKPDSPAFECRAAIELGLRALMDENIEGGTYKLVEVRNLLKGAQSKSDPNVWLLTLKARRLIPSVQSVEIGAGDEIYFEVNLSSGQVHLTGRGD